MKSGTKSNRLFPLLNLEKENAVDLARWIVAACSTPSSMSFARAARGGFCQETLARGRPSMAIFAGGVRIGPGRSFTTRCEISCARLKGEKSLRPQLSLIANRSRSPIKREHVATTQAKRCRGANATWLWICLGLILAMRITPASVQDRVAAKRLIHLLVTLCGRLQIIWADGGYLGKLVQWVKQLRPFGQLKLEIVRRSDRANGFEVLPKRWIVERTFGWLIKSRRLCRDYEVRLDHSEAMVRICMIRLMVKRLANV